MVKILHFADAHIDMASLGRRDPQSGLPLRVLDFLKSLDQIVNTAIEEKVDLVIFAGDAYKDRSPAPTYQREWGKRVMRLSRAGIPTLLLVGNHDTSPALGRAHALDAFETLEVPNVIVVDSPALLRPQDLFELPLQVLALPWIPRSSLLANVALEAVNPESINEAIEERIAKLVNEWLDNRDPSLPTVLTAHASVQGARYGAERSIMLGRDFTLSGALVRDPRLDYVALGHIHLAQNLNDGAHPPVIYPGSIERVDFGEAKDEKFFIIAHVQRGQTQVEWRKLTHVRPFLDIRCQLKEKNSIENSLLSALPAADQMTDAIVRFVIDYPREWENLIDDKALRALAAPAFEFHLVKHPLIDNRTRLPDHQSINSLSPQELLDLYMRSNHTPSHEADSLLQLANEIFQEPDTPEQDQ
jgi:exonuclease SbcD